MPEELASMPEEMAELDEAVVVEGHVVTESKSDDYNKVWEALETARDAQTTVQAFVVDAVRGGLAVDLGIRGFIPKSEIATRHLTNLERYIGQTLDAKIVDADRETGRLVLSQRRASEEQRAAMRAETLSKLEKGMVVDGIVRRITNFGAFVDIGGIDGLLHISDLAWENVEKVEDVVNVDDKVQVQVLKIEQNGERISLGLKQLTDDPWTAVRREIRQDALLEVTVVRVEQAGVVVSVRKGIDGFIPASELPQRRGEEESLKLEPGQVVTAKVEEMHSRERRLILSIKQAERDRERQQTRDYMKKQQQENNATLTLGDLYGDLLSKFGKDKK